MVVGEVTVDEIIIGEREVALASRMALSLVF